MGLTSLRVAQIIAAAQPNNNLMSRVNRPLDIEQQKAREQKLYNQIKLVDPITHEPIQTIEQLNNLVIHLDQAYNLEALLPFGSTANSGEVERLLSSPPFARGKGYNLNLRGKNKFTEKEQIAIKTRLQALANEAFRILTNDTYFINHLHREATNQLWEQILAYMGALQYKVGVKTLFLNITAEKQNYNVREIYKEQEIYQDLYDKGIEIFRMSTLLENIKGTKRTTSRGGFGFVRDENKDIIGIEFNPDLNGLSSKAFNDFYDFASREGLLENNLNLDARNTLGKGTVSPMDVDANEWRDDVFTAVYTVLTKTGAQFTKDELDQLFIKYNVPKEIALGRSISNLRGFTGELRAILLSHLLFPAGSQSLAGTSKVTLENSTKRGEAPLDIVINLLNEVYGIQVKNISDLDSYSWGNIRDNKGMTLPGFYNERLQSDLDNKETNFFGAYVYNQPVAKDIPYERHIYSQFEKVFEYRFAPVYSKLALYIIRQITAIKNSDNPLLSGTLKNDLFFMNNKIIPASALMQALQTDSDLITSSFILTKPGIGFYRSGAKQPADYSSYTNKAGIRYEIEIQYARLLTSAYNAS